MVGVPLAVGLVALALGLAIYWWGGRGRPARPIAWPRLILSLAGGVLAVGLLIQLVPYGRDHSNPPITGEPAWDTAETRALAQRACFDCHSNEVAWPWYANVAPLSWLVQFDVDEGRAKLNFSEFDRPQGAADEAAETVQDGTMPTRPYVLLHPDARLSDAEQAALIRGLTATLGAEGNERDEDDERD